jgi:hypothetical protein
VPFLLGEQDGSPSQPERASQGVDKEESARANPPLRATGVLDAHRALAAQARQDVACISPRHKLERPLPHGILLTSAASHRLEVGELQGWDSDSRSSARSPPQRFVIATDTAFLLLHSLSPTQRANGKIEIGVWIGLVLQCVMPPLGLV